MGSLDYGRFYGVIEGAYRGHGGLETAVSMSVSFFHAREGDSALRRGAGEAVEIARRPSSMGLQVRPARRRRVDESRAPVASDDVSGCSHQPSSSRASHRLDSFTVLDGINEMIDSHDDLTARRTGARQRVCRDSGPPEPPMRPAHQAHGACGRPWGTPR